MRQPKKLGIGIIGCGAISIHHTKAYEALSEHCELKALSDLDRTKAARLAESIGHPVEQYDDYKQMLARDDIDVVSICTPPFAHKELVIHALRSGKHVLCEKPLAPSLRDCDEMIEASREHGKKLAVVFQYRFRQDFRQLKHVVQSGVLGQLTFAQMNGLYWRGDNYYNVPWRGKWETECGGVTMNHAIHPLDIFLWMMGDVESVYAEMDTLAHEIEVEDSLMAMIRFRSGAVGQIACTVNTPGAEISFKISGKYASAALPVMGKPLVVRTKRDTDTGGGEPDVELMERIVRLADEVKDGYPVHNHQGSILDLFRSIRDGGEPLVSGCEGRKDIEVITALYKSGSTGARVRLPIGKDDPWYTAEGIESQVKKGRAL